MCRNSRRRRRFLHNRLRCSWNRRLPEHETPERYEHGRVHVLEPEQRSAAFRTCRSTHRRRRFRHIHVRYSSVLLQKKLLVRVCVAARAAGRIGLREVEGALVGLLLELVPAEWTAVFLHSHRYCSSRRRR